jgi:CheY-like chemotaxis protein
MPNIIWIEDDADILRTVIRPMELANFRFRIINKISEIWEYIEEIRNADLILLDLIMPSGSSEEMGSYPGLEVLVKLRKDYSIGTPAIIFSVITNSRSEVLRQLVGKGTELGIVDIIPKPIRPSELKKRVEEALNGKLKS